MEFKLKKSPAKTRPLSRPSSVRPSKSSEIRKGAPVTKLKNKTSPKKTSESPKKKPYLPESLSDAKHPSVTSRPTNHQEIESPRMGSVFPLTLPEMHDVLKEKLDHDADDSMRLDKFENLSKWAKSEQENLQRDLTTLFDALKPSKLSNILQEIESNTFDDDKYMVTKRVDSHIRKAYQTALTQVRDGSIPSYSSATNYAFPVTHEHTNYANLVPRGNTISSNAALLTAAGTTRNMPQGGRQTVFHQSHPPPLFTHRWATHTSEARGAPSRDTFPDHERQQRRRRKGSAVKKEKVKVDHQGKGTGKQSSSNHHAQRDHDYPGARELSPPSLMTEHDYDTRKAKHEKPQLQFIHHKGVDIPTRNITERVGVISISPRDVPARYKKRHQVVEVIHESTDHSSTVESYHREDNAFDGNIPQHDSVEQYSEEFEIASQDVEERRPSSATSPSPSSFVAPVLDKNVPYEPSADNGVVLRDAEDLEQSRVYPEKSASVQFSGDDDNFEHTSSQSTSKGVVDMYYDDDESSQLPGYMPEMKWEEVTIGDRQDETQEFLRERLRAAEDRILQNDMQEMILNRLEDRLQQMILPQQDDFSGMDRVIEESEPLISQLNPAIDPHGQEMGVAAETVRAMLFDLVRERIHHIPDQRYVEPQPSSERILESWSSESRDSSHAVETHSSVATPSGSPRAQVLPSDSERIGTPSPSPPMSPVKEDIAEKGIISTPQHSLEEYDEAQIENISTPTSSLSEMSVIDRFSTKTPDVSPTTSPNKVKPIYPASTPAMTPAGSPSKVNPRYFTDTPAVTPVDSPSKLTPRYPTVTPAPTPGCSPAKLQPRRSSTKTPSQSPLPPPDQREVIIVTPINTPRSYRVTDVQDQQPNTPSLTLSPINAEIHSEPMDEQLDPGSLPSSPFGKKHPGIVTSITYCDEGTQVEHLSSEDTISVVCHSSSEITESSPNEASDTTYMTLSEGEVLNDQSSVNISMEDGELARTCFLNLPRRGTRTCVSHKELQSRIKECESASSESEMMSSSICKESSDNGSQYYIGRQFSDNSTSNVLENSKSHLLTEGSDMSVVQNESFSSGSAAAVSSECLESLRQENSTLLHRLNNLGSLSFLNRISQSQESSSEDSSK